MSRNISTELQAHLAGDTITVCTCVLITRQDGTKLGFSNLNDTFDFDGETYYPSGTISATAVSSSLASGVDNLDLKGVIDSDLISAEDLPLFTSARVEIFRINYEDHTMGKLVLFSGRFGNIKVEDDEVFFVELLSTNHLLRQSVGDLTSATCRVRRFGDDQCKLNIASYTHNRTVDAVSGVSQVTFAADSAATGYYNNGTVEMTSGANIGLKREIKTHTLSSGKAILVLRWPFPFPIEVGDTAELIRGCDRRFETCRDVYSNAINFRGEPHLPGNDTVGRVGRIPG